MKKIYILFCFALFIFANQVLGQELDAKISISTTKIQSVDKQAMKQLEDALRTMLNEQTWSNAKFERIEKIDCTFGITLNSMPTEGSYGAEIHITTRRPVYSSSYVTSLLNYRDTKFDFSYAVGQYLDYNEISINNNLVAVTAFYINIILGLDFDSFSLNGGRPYFTRAMEIANMAQTLGAKGWEPFDGKSRYDLALALTEESSASFHKLWYNYHRMGLDEMTSNLTRGRIRMLETVADLEELYKVRPNSVLLDLFAEAKLTEFVNMCEKATTEEKRDVKERLKKLFPSKRRVIDAMP